MRESKIVTINPDLMPRLTCEEVERIWENTPDQIDYSDSPEITDEDLITGRVVEISGKNPISIRLDSDILAFFRKGGPGYQTRINQVLRDYMNAQTAPHLLRLAK